MPPECRKPTRPSTFPLNNNQILRAEINPLTHGFQSSRTKQTLAKPKPRSAGQRHRKIPRGAAVIYILEHIFQNKPSYLPPLTAIKPIPKISRMPYYMIENSSYPECNEQAQNTQSWEINSICRAFILGLRRLFGCFETDINPGC